MCLIDEAEGGWDLLREGYQKARKEYRCEECNREILGGDRYWYTAAKTDGYLFTYRACEHCRAASAWLTMECSGFLCGGVLEDLCGHLEETKQYNLRRLIVGIRRKWRRRNGALMPVPVALAVTK